MSAEDWMAGKNADPVLRALDEAGHTGAVFKKTKKVSKEDMLQE